jgi:ABC-type Fe3+/spermidine/putrescine transport system ATPase subunit
MPPYLVLDRLAKSFGGARVLDGLTLAAGRGEVVALLGPSGSGKTTALRLVAGFESPDPAGGRVLIDGEDVTGLPPARRNFGMVFQHYALFPHLSVGENVAFGLEGRRRQGREQIAARVAAALALVDLPGYERRRVGEISGGQQQRVALARALAPEPRVLLLDEPLSNLDPALRERTRRELRRAIRRVGITTLLVTHEQEEAFHLGDRVAVLEGGVLHQVGSPEELYDRPATRFVAVFVGRASVLPGTFAGGGERGMVRLDGLAPAAGGGAGGADANVVAWAGEAAEALADGEAVDLVVRPEALALVPAATSGALAGRVAERRYAGAATYYEVELGAAAIGAGGGGDGSAATGTAGAASGRALAGSAPVAGGLLPGEVEVLAGPAAAAPGDEVAVAPVRGDVVPAGRIFRRSAELPPASPGGPAMPTRPGARAAPAAAVPGSLADRSTPPTPAAPAAPPAPQNGGQD